MPLSCPCSMVPWFRHCASLMSLFNMVPWFRHCLFLRVLVQWCPGLDTVPLSCPCSIWCPGSDTVSFYVSLFNGALVQTLCISTCPCSMVPWFRHCVFLHVLVQWCPGSDTVYFYMSLFNGALVQTLCISTCPCSMVPWFRHCVFLHVLVQWCPGSDTVYFYSIQTHLLHSWNDSEQILLCSKIFVLNHASLMLSLFNGALVHRMLLLWERMFAS